MNTIQKSDISDDPALAGALSNGEVNQGPSVQIDTIEMSGITYVKNSAGGPYWGIFKDDRPFLLIKRLRDPFNKKKAVEDVVNRFFGTGSAYLKLTGEAHGFGEVLICVKYDEKALQIVKIAAFPTAWQTDEIAAKFAYLSIEFYAQRAMDEAREELTKWFE